MEQTVVVILTASLQSTLNIFSDKNVGNVLQDISYLFLGGHFTTIFLLF